MPTVIMYVQCPAFLKLRVIEFRKYAILFDGDVYAHSCNFTPSVCIYLPSVYVCLNVYSILFACLACIL